MRWQSWIPWDSTRCTGAVSPWAAWSGQWLAANAPDRIDKLILSNTSSYFADKVRWNDRIKTVREKGVGAVADAVMKLWFTADFRAREPETIAA